MESDSFIINWHIKQVNDLKLLLNRIDKKLSFVANELNWDYEKLLEEDPSNMVICSVNNQHRVPQSKLSSHEEKCKWKQEGYRDDDQFFPEHSGSGSFVTLTTDLLNSITASIASSSGPQPPIRSIPETSAKFDQNFSRTEKLAIYDCVIANTEKQKCFSDLCFQSLDKKEGNEKKEMAPWEIAAAERDARRRRMSYKKKVHTNRKSQTEILREVIEVQMELLREEISHSRLSTTDKIGKEKEGSDKKHGHDSKSSKEYSKYSSRETSSRRDRDDRHKSRSHDRHSKHSEDRTRKRSPSFTGNDSHSRSRSHDRFRKRKTYDGRSHSYKSSKHSLQDKDDSARSRQYKYFRKDGEHHRNSYRHGER